MAVNFMGLTGPMGVLPRVYTELIMSRLRARDRTLADFFDIFNHRMISLFYQAWEKYRSSVAYERDGEDRLSKYLMSLIGLGTDGLQNRMLVRDDSLLFYSGLLSLQPRSAAALRGVLQDYFGVPVEVEQFVGAWQPLGSSRSVRPGQRRVVRLAARRGHRGGRRNLESAVADPPETGPADAGAVPGLFARRGRLSNPCASWRGSFAAPTWRSRFSSSCERAVVPRCDLGEDSLAGPRLGWFTWMKSGPDFDRAPADTVLLLA